LKTQTPPAAAPRSDAIRLAAIEPAPASAAPPPAGQLPDIFAREKRLILEARHADGIRNRWAVMGLGVTIAAITHMLGLAAISIDVFVVLIAALVVVNGLAAWALGSGRFAEWQFWGCVVFSILLIGGLTAALLTQGYLLAIVFMFALSAYALGFPAAVYVQLALTALVYPAGRLLGYALAGEAAPVGMIVMETLLLVAIGWRMVVVPLGYTRRLRRVREALARMAERDFSERLPEGQLDDVGFTSASVNHVAQAVADVVLQMQEQARTLAALSDELAATAEEVQASAEEIGSTTEEMAADAERQMAVVGRGAESVELVVQQSQTLSEEASESAADARRLGGDARGKAQRAGQAGQLLE
jgi:methyl-accepting chemotaxis protein